MALQAFNLVVFCLIKNSRMAYEQWQVFILFVFYLIKNSHLAYESTPATIFDAESTKSATASLIQIAFDCFFRFNYADDQNFAPVCIFCLE